MVLLGSLIEMSGAEGLRALFSQFVHKMAEFT